MGYHLDIFVTFYSFFGYFFLFGDFTANYPSNKKLFLYLYIHIYLFNIGRDFPFPMREFVSINVHISRVI